jgi:methylenetetrahydrofolate dehydrogenase (NADP+) / methenyltetrahydrofolate cyclohydrolase
LGFPPLPYLCPMQLLDGKIAAAALKLALQQETANYKAKGLRAPHLAAILVGSDGASETYVANKVKTCEELGYQSTMLRLDASTTEAALIAAIEQFNKADNIDGILVQLPLPKHISETSIINTIDPQKDVDGFHPVSVGRLVQGLPTFVPATPFGIVLMLQHFGIATSGQHAVVIGRSNIVGRPMSILLSSSTAYGNATVTLCHSKTKDLQAQCLQADIIVAALGIPGFVKADMVKPGAVVIDVGITRVADATKKIGFAIKGDVDFAEVAPKCSYITPVPGGVGLMTIGALMKNTMEAYKQRMQLTK